MNFVNTKSLNMNMCMISMNKNTKTLNKNLFMNLSSKNMSMNNISIKMNTKKVAKHKSMNKKIPSMKADCYWQVLKACGPEEKMYLII